MRDRYENLRSMALNEDRTFLGRVRIFFRRYKLAIAAALCAILYLMAAYYDNRDYRQSLERRIHSLSTAVLQNHCLVTQDSPVGLVMIADTPNRLYDILADVAAIADGQRASLFNARKK